MGAVSFGAVQPGTGNASLEPASQSTAGVEGKCEDREEGDQIGLEFWPIETSS